MITSPEDYIKLLLDIQNQSSFYKTYDETFKPNKKYYKKVVNNAAGDPTEDPYDESNVYTHELITGYNPGDNIIAWETANNTLVYENLGINEDSYLARKSVILLPTDETIFEVDLNKRTVNVPQFLSVQTEHNAETLYFKMSRYFENMDLSQTTCVIQYINANGEGGLYAVPFVDVDTYKDTNEMLVPWAIGGKVTKYPGEVTFSIRFYKIDNNSKHFDYNLSTLPQKGEILYGFDPVDKIDEPDYNIETSLIEVLIERIEGFESRLGMYWINV